MVVIVVVSVTGVVISSLCLSSQGLAWQLEWMEMLTRLRRLESCSSLS